MEIDVDALCDDIALERTTLEAALNTRSGGSSTGIIDLRGSAANVSMNAEVSLCGQAIESFVARVMLPLLFASAWKILDLIVERAWREGGSQPSIARKAKRALEEWDADLTPIFQGDRGLAERTGRLYEATVQLRHAIIHRRTLKGANGDVSYEGGAPIHAESLQAICRFALGVSQVLGTKLERRTRSDLAWWLNQLTSIHGMPALDDAYKPRPLDKVLVLAQIEEGQWHVDTERALQRTRGINQGFPFADLLIHAPGDEFPVISTPLENAPRGLRVRFDPSASHIWWE
jgi:hypothetical protein